VKVTDAKGAGDLGIMKITKILASCTAALLLVACAGGPNERSTGQVLDDATILAKTKAALVNDPEIKGSSIDVDVERGVVTLTGVARSQREKDKVVQTAYGVTGVKSVQTDIQIKAPNP